MKVAISYSNFKFSRVAKILFFVSVGVLVSSLLFSPFYYEGDSIPYANAYVAVFGQNLVDGLLVYTSTVSSVEPVHYLIIWTTSNLGIDKNLVTAIANSILAYLMMRVFLQWRVSLYVALAIVFTNFYVLVLYFAAERLKFGFIFLMLSLLYCRERKLSAAFAMTAVLAHSQNILIYVGTLFSSVITDVSASLKTGRFRLKKVLLLVLIIAVSVGSLNLIEEYLSLKFEYYNVAAQENSFFDLWKILVFLLLTLRYTTDRLNVISTFFILLLVATLVGPDRINMIAYCFFMFYALQYNSGVNAGVILTTLYFGIKSIYFILDILATGQGFSQVGVMLMGASSILS
jgi:hypothetical protein